MEKYIDYINEIDVDFVKNFAKEYCKLVFKSDKIRVQKASDRWVITCKINFNHDALFHLKDFEFVNISTAYNPLGENMWRKALIGKFGKQYYSEMCMFLYEKLYDKHNHEKERLKDELENYKQALPNQEIIHKELDDLSV